MKTAIDCLDDMEALVRRIAQSGLLTGAVAEARRIVTELPEPVDPDLVMAREIVAAEYGDGGNVAHLAASALSGKGDEWFATKIALRALRRAREEGVRS